MCIISLLPIPRNNVYFGKAVIMDAFTGQHEYVSFLQSTVPLCYQSAHHIDCFSAGKLFKTSVEDESDSETQTTVPKLGTGGRNRRR